jgi:hypothetical protein
MNRRQEYIVAALLIAFTIAFRLINNASHFLNFAPMLALSLFAGSIFRSKQLAYATPLVAIVLSDLCLGLFTREMGYYGLSQIVNYIAYAIVVALGTTLKSVNASKVILYSVASSIVFFLISNFGVWAETTFNLYPKNWQGFTACYTAAIAFYRQQIEANYVFNPITADILYASLFFGGYHLAKQFGIQKQLA